MVSKAKKKSSKFSRGQLVIIITLVLVFVFVFFGWKNGQDHEDKQTKLINSLYKSGLDLDGVNNSLESVSDLKFIRDSYCYEPGRKSGPTPIYCYQTIGAEAVGLSDDKINSLVPSISSALVDNEFMLFKVDGSTDIDEDGVGSIKLKATNTPGCTALISYKLNNAVERSPESEVSLEVRCSGMGEFDEFIYPERTY